MALLFGFGLCAEVGLELCFVLPIEVGRVGVRYGEVVVKGCAAEDELLAAGCCVCEYAEGVVCEDAEHEVVEMFVCELVRTVVVVVVLDCQVDALVGSGEHAVDLGVCPDGDTLGNEVIFPFLVEVVQTVKRVHGGLIRQQRILIVVPELHVGIVEQPLDNGRGHVRRLVARPEEQRNERIDHLVAKVPAEEEEAQHDGDGDQAEQGHRPLDDFEEEAEAFDVGGVLGDELAGEAVCPEAGFSLAEGDLQLERLGWGAMLVEEVEGVLEDLERCIVSLWVFAQDVEKRKDENRIEKA